MAPTIGSNDQMLIDRSIDTLRIADQIWAFTFGGFGMVKRLRPRPDGSVAILSDNPNVPEDRAVDDELFIIGRVVAIVRKV
ncbi:transcriptional regulator [Qipengyuania citrea LAMA 915]|uniref:Transcriptional regulator n=2 Tax=Qipengyuania citrea TaxID=225971 RepID=A0A0L1KFK9_9SPHN|nr:transcriptional regulator [Qipengyuania citrea LAMA 915]